MSNNNQVDKATILEKDEFMAIRAEFSTDKYRLLWDIAWYTGRAWTEILNLSVDDIWDEKGLRDFIRFDSDIPIHPKLRISLEAYGRPSGCCLFPGRDTPTKPMSYQAVHKNLKSAIQNAGLEGRNITAYSTAVSFTQRLLVKGVDPKLIKKLTGRTPQSLHSQLNTRLAGALTLL